MSTLNARVRLGLATVISLISITLLPACERGAEEARAPATPGPAAAAPASPGDAGALAPAAGPPAAAAGPTATSGPERATESAPQVEPPAARTFQATSSGLSSGGAQMTFENTVHDFGVVWDVQSDLPCEFAFTNTGTATLEIVEMKADCGCTVPALTKRRYDPGERGVINVLYSPKGIGPTEKFINLITNVGGQGVARVGIRAENKRFVWADPPNLQFQPAKVGVPHRAVVTVNSADPDFRIDRVWTSAGSVHATGASDFLEARLIEGTSPPQVEVVLTEEAPWGSSFTTAFASGSGTIPHGEERDFRVRIMVKADLFGELRADRTYYTLKLVPPGSSFEQSVRIWRESGEPFTILGTEIRESTMPGVKVEARPITDADLAGYDIVLFGETGRYAGAIKGSVIVKTDLPGEEEIELRFSGLVREPQK